MKQLGTVNYNHMIPYPGLSENWPGGFCNFEGATIGQEKISEYIVDENDAVLTNFTRCKIPIEGEISGVY